LSTENTGNPAATHNLPGPAFSVMNSVIDTGIAAETGENPTACRRLYAVFENLADEPTAENEPFDLFDSFDIARLIGGSPPEADSVPAFNLLDSILSEVTRDATVIIPPITTEDVGVQCVEPVTAEKDTQTPVGSLYLPHGMNLKTLLDEVFTDTDSSATSITTRLSRSMPLPLPDERNVLEAVITGMVEAQRRLVELVVARQRQINSVDLPQAELLGRSLECFVHTLRERPASGGTILLRPTSDWSDILDISDDD